jgi:hypothetical protein
MRNQAVTRGFHTSKFNFRKFGSANFDGYLVL